MRKLDKLWGSIGKEGARCEICQSLSPNERFNYTQLHPHHIIGRSSKRTRWDLKNRLWVCPRHHTLGLWKETVQDNLGGWFLSWFSDEDWMSKHRPEDKEYLLSVKNEIKQWTLEELEELLNTLCPLPLKRRGT